MLGIINAKVVSLGRHGRTKKIRLDIPLKIIEDMIRSDPTLSPLLNFKLRNERLDKILLS